MAPDDLSVLVVRRRQILRSAARLVRPGGRLVYVTCSLLHEENEEQAEAFLAAALGFVLVSARRVWRYRIGNPLPGGGRRGAVRHRRIFRRKLDQAS
jgi:16S rRNA (cytosine967-C5)-methyltransferase